MLNFRLSQQRSSLQTAIAPLVSVAVALASFADIALSQGVRPLPGRLDRVPVFNSNSPELVLEEGILLSTFPPEDKAVPEAHLDFPFAGRFDIFAHHVARAPEPDDLRSLYLGIVAYNPNDEPVRIDILRGATYLSQPDAPFIGLPAQVPNPDGEVYAGPGSRVGSDVLRGWRSSDLPESVTISPGETRLLLNRPIPVRELEPPLNGRSALLHLDSDNPVYVASLALYAPQTADGERAPTLEEWRELLQTGDLARPRDLAPTPPGDPGPPFRYGRVAGVARGSVWRSRLTDENSNVLAIAPPGEAIFYGLSTLPLGQLGTGQSQSAEMLVRYPDTAYFAHGNYGIRYSLTLPLLNPTDETQTVEIALETPVKEDELSTGELQFLDPPDDRIFFRGTVRIRYLDRNGWQTNYWHLVQRRGQRGEALATLDLEPGDRRLVRVDFLYPPDATPPQVLSVRTQKQ